MKNLLRRLHNDENGQDLVEYALVAALIGLGSVTAMKTLSNYISNAFTTVGSTLVSSV
jgi:pilus assembly protein Flp/PilA